MKPTRILLILVAIIAGGLAAFLATRGGDQPVEQPIVTEVVQQTSTKVLVAIQAIGVGERLSPEKLEWHDWPESALRPEYITSTAAPEAMTEMTGAVARFEIFAGDPLRQDKLVRADQGYLSAVLEQGMRGVSIRVTPASGAGGFIVPNDRVDVILTTSGPNGQQSQPVLNNVKVLAIGQRLGEKGATGAPADPENPRAEVFVADTIATVEVNPDQADILINAAAVGQLSLTLRSIADFREDATVAAKRKANEPIRVIGYGVEKSVMAGTSPQASAAAPLAAEPVTVDPASYDPGSPSRPDTSGAIQMSPPPAAEPAATVQ